MKFFKDKLNNLLEEHKKLSALKEEISCLYNNNVVITKKIEEQLSDIGVKEKQINKIINDAPSGFSYVADVISEFLYYRDIKTADFLEEKKNPSIKGANDIRIIANEKKKLLRENKILKSYIKLYEHLFPFISDLQPIELEYLLNNYRKGNSINDENDDPVKKYVPEYEMISESERNQRALDRYIKSKIKKKWMIGIMYERYIGYLYEQEGYKVDYFGARQGYDDLGRDLICIKNSETLIIQCKYWSKNKVISEPHINQLFGTTIKYCIDKNNNYSDTLFGKYFNPNDYNVKPILITSITATETAHEFAEALGVEIIENKKMDYDYPMIKCNLKEKIYHLPFDQQYDKMIIKNDLKYVKTIKEAENLDCRRAFRWNDPQKHKNKF